MRYTIRKMEKSDAIQLAALEAQCFSVPWSVQSFTDEAENSLASYYIAVFDGEIIGYAGFWRVIDEGHITNIAVNPSFRRNGIASALLSRIIREGYDSHLIFFTLEVRKSNSAAQELYKSFGFKPLGARKAYYHEPLEDAVIMTLMLGEE